MLDKELYLTPRQIVDTLDKYIIGQKEAKRNVAIALRNRWRRMNVTKDIQAEIMPNNILMIGATGVGKTEIARRLAKLADAPFTKVEASKFTEVGYVGRDVESMVRDLTEQAIGMVKEKKQAEVQEKANEAVEEIILYALIPPLKEEQTVLDGKDHNTTKREVNGKTRDYFRQKIKNKEIEDTKIKIAIEDNNSSHIGIVGGGIDELSMMNIQEMISGMMPKKKKKRKVSIKEARKLLQEEEVAKLIDMEEIKEVAIKKTEDTGIIFIDEIDKVASSNNKAGSADVSREGVQRDLLPIVEGSAVNTKYGIVRTDHILFIAAGAFHVSKPSDLIPELQGRFPIRVELNSLSKDDFYQILKEPKNALTKQYTALFEAEEISLSFTDEALREIAAVAFHINEEIENIGARRLHTVMSHLLNDFLFDVPDEIEASSRISITRKAVKERLETLSTNKDLSQYIL